MKFSKNEGSYILGCLEESMEEALDQNEYNDFWNVKNKYETVCNEDMSCDYTFSNAELNIMNSSLIGQLQYLVKGEDDFFDIEKIIDKIEREQVAMKKASKTEKIAV